MKQYLKYSFFISVSALSGFFSRPVLADAIYLKVHKIFDGEKWFSPGYIHIVADRITYLGETPLKKGNKSPPPYKDLKGTTLLPALVDAHQHLSITDPHFSANYEKAFRYSDQLSFKEKKTIGLSLLNDYLHKGFLYIRDLGGDVRTLKAIKEETKRSNHYPFIQWSAKPVAHGHGQCPKDLSCKRYFQAPNDFQYIKGETLKVYLDNDPFPGKLALKELKSILERDHGFIAFHSIYPYPLKKLIPYLDESDSLEHIYSITEKQLKKLAPTEVRLVPTDLPKSFIENYVENYKEEIPLWSLEEINIQAKRIQRLAPYTSQLCFGSDFYIDPHDPIRTRAYWALEGFFQQVKRLKLTPTQALKTITSQCAPLFAHHKNLGTLKVDAIANVIIVEGDLSKDLALLHNIQWVIKKGKILVQP